MVLRDTSVRRSRTARVALVLALGATLLAASVAASPASALTVKRSWSKRIVFDGAGCKSASVVRLRLPRRARHLHVSSPHVGQRFHDVETNRVVARVTRIVKSRTRLRLVARGTADACSNPNRYSG